MNPRLSSHIAFCDEKGSVTSGALGEFEIIRLEEEPGSVLIAVRDGAVGRGGVWVKSEDALRVALGLPSLS